MKTIPKVDSQLSEQVREFVRRDFVPRFGLRTEAFRSNAKWKPFRDLGTELWLDSGNLDDIADVWTREFTGLTTDNTLLNEEIRTGRYDGLIREAVELLRSFPELTEKERLLEVRFIVNAKHALRLVEEFDAHVSVEEHTSLAHDVAGTLEYARRYHAICPERFSVKIPFTAAGILATQRASQEGIPVNHTLGFSARQNYLVARLAQPAFVNVFLGPLNRFVTDNGLGSGDWVGEKAILASQRPIRRLRQSRGVPTRQIGASFHTWEQYIHLAGIDVMTVPPSVARQWLVRGNQFARIDARVDWHYDPGIRADVDPSRIRLDTLWEIDDPFLACVEALEQEDLDSFKPQELVNFFQAHGCAAFLTHWSNSQIETSRQEGKIPRLENWGDSLADGLIALDSLMNLAALNSLIMAQEQMDEHIRQVGKRTER